MHVCRISQVWFPVCYKNQTANVHIAEYFSIFVCLCMTFSEISGYLVKNVLLPFIKQAEVWCTTPLAIKSSQYFSFTWTCIQVVLSSSVTRFFNQVCKIKIFHCPLGVFCDRYAPCPQSLKHGKTFQQKGKDFCSLRHRE